MTSKKLIVKVGSLEETLSKFKNVWKKAARGEKISPQIDILSFEDPNMLMKTLSPKRLELLQAIHGLGKVSIRQLAKHLERDYSNVHTDVKAMHNLGIVLIDNENKYFVPWNKIVTEIPMHADIEKPLINKHRHAHVHHKGSTKIADHRKSIR